MSAREMQPGDEPTWVVCLNVGAEKSATELAFGAVERRCAIGRCKIWVAPSTLRLMEDKPAIQLVCNNCVKEVEQLEGGKPDDVLLPPGSEQEMKNAGMSDEEIDRVLTYIRERYTKKGDG